MATTSFVSSPTLLRCGFSPLPQCRHHRFWRWKSEFLGFENGGAPLLGTTSVTESKARRNLVCVVGLDAEKSFKKTLEVDKDKLIDVLKDANTIEAKEDGDKPGLEAMLKKVLLLYASRVLSKRSFAKKGNEILKAEEFLETIIKDPEEEWNKLLIKGLSLGKGEITPEEFYDVIRKRTERVSIRTGGSYQQRVLTEYISRVYKRHSIKNRRGCSGASEQATVIFSNEYRLHLMSTS